MKKKLVFHFYFGDEWKTNPIVKIHLNCLRHYCNIFDDVEIVIAVNNPKDKKKTREIKETILRYIDNNRISLIVEENTPLREAKTFYNEVLNGDEQYNGIIFFGHSKGYSNLNGENNKDAIVEWICGLYFLSLEFADEAYKKLAYGTEKNNGVCYGSFLQITDNGMVHSEYPYSGTFYWINVNTIKHNDFKIPFLDNRFYAEKFPSDLNKKFFIESHNASLIYQTTVDFYHNPMQVRQAIDFICQDSKAELKRYEDFKKEVLAVEV